MPYKSEKIPIAGTKLDLRRKLSPEQKNAIKILSEQGYSQRKLAEMFGCSKRSVQNILHPEERKPAVKSPTEYWTQKKREYRQRKQQMYVDGKLQNIKIKKKK
mgnify:FL=1|jgi:transposase